MLTSIILSMQEKNIQHAIIGKGIIFIASYPKAPFLNYLQAKIHNNEPIIEKYWLFVFITAINLLLTKEPKMG